ncbi:MAG: EF-hand domain-containing protein [Planctomycetota bacterium]
MKSVDPLVGTDDIYIGGVAPASPFPVKSFDGLGSDDNVSTIGFRTAPPDTNGDVGPNQYVQMINLIFAIFDKNTGAMVLGPAANNSLWTGFGGPCETNNDGDPIVLYDHLADRWLFSQFALAADGHQCIAVSGTPDPTGPYHRYDFVVVEGGANDVPKIGVWPDGYYLSFNEFSPGFVGVGTVALERDKMLIGKPAQIVKFTVPPAPPVTYYSLQPSHLEGPPPPPGTPNTYLMAYDDNVWGDGSGLDGYYLFDLSVNWSMPAASTLTPQGIVLSPPFDATLCGFFVSCVPQPETTQRLDSHAVFTMYRLQYRTFGRYATLVANHTVDVGSERAGIRWSELRNSGTGWSLYQSGTHAPSDGLHRWMGSIAMNGLGDIALGYSVSSSSTFPSVRYATRTAADPLGTLPGGEGELVAGTGSQLSPNRWGDHSSMSVDPVDDCTFWYTGEYVRTTGSFSWATRIGALTAGDPALDSDGDGLPDRCDPCAGGAASGDTDANGTLDLDDYADFALCLFDPDGGLGTGCECFDGDGDSDIDLRDFAEFQEAFGR